MALGIAAPALAGEEPLYQPAPAWLVPAPAIDPTKAAAGAPIVLFDMQQRLEQGRVWNVTDIAMRADTPESLAQLGTISMEWSPDQGDLIIHRVHILRAGETVDVLAASKFTVLRREQQLERRVMLGTLTGTLTVPGLRVGDILRYTASITQADPALAGRVQLAKPLFPEPFAAQFARARASWPVDSQMRHRIGPNMVEPSGALRTEGNYRIWEMRLPLARRPELPDDAPLRFKLPPMLQVSDFASWQDLSKVMAPLFASKGLIVPGGALAGEVAAIKAATSDPEERTSRALAIVQSRIAYLLLGMNGGNYIPQPPEKTWETRLGDCKAKTLLLLAMLRDLDVEAEPVLARSVAGDALPDAQPMAGNFDHVLVRAQIDGKDLWLDGTGAGARRADLHDVPGFRHVLPLRLEGADLLALPARPNARPDVAVDLKLDQSAGAVFPNIFDLTVTYRGAQGAQMRTAWLQASPRQRLEAAAPLANQHVGEAQIAESSFAYDEVSGLATFKARGLTTTSWKTERSRRRQTLQLAQVPFGPDRARTAWRDIPAASAGPATFTYRTTIALPENGRGIAFEGNADIDETIAGAHLQRSGKLENGTYTLTEAVAWSGAEIPPDQIAVERTKAATVAARSAILVAPEDTLPAAAYAAGALRAKLKSYDTIYAEIIARNPDLAQAYASRANYRAGILDWKGAIADVDKALTLEPSALLHLQRAGLLRNLGDKAGAVGSARNAASLEPDNTGAVIFLANLLGESGQQREALDVLQHRIDNGGADRFKLIMAKSELMADGGDAPGAVALLDTVIAGRPGDPELLNARCWLKGTRNVALETALVDCTKAMQLTDSPAPILDSRAMVFYRLGKFDDALSDIEAALQSAPDLAPTQFMRGIVLNRLGRNAAGQTEIDQAKRKDPTVVATYGKYGIAP
jgi:tetratricopeptide (TPR) repeat protein/transglutaminase-like putative cysteine protease